MANTAKIRRDLQREFDKLMSMIPSGGEVPSDSLGNVYYVDSNNGSSSYPGTRVDRAKATLAQAFALCSANDTIIVMDRIRENLQRHKGMGLIENVDLSINETLSRTIITSLTVLFVVVVLYFRTQGDIKNFAFAMIIGVLTGTYSSVSIASPIFIFLKQHGHRFGMGKTAPVKAKS